MRSEARCCATRGRVTERRCDFQHPNTLYGDSYYDAYNGGVITVEPFDFPGGRRFQFRGPGGNELSVWTPADDQ